MRFGNSSSSSGSLFSGGLFGGPHPQLVSMFQLYGWFLNICSVRSATGGAMV